MEPCTPTVTPDASTILQAQMRECFGRVCYSHKVHEKCADIYLGRNHRLKLAQIALAAITTGGLLAILFDDAWCAKVVAAITATVSLVLNAYTKEHDLGQLAQQHAAAASRLWSVRESYLSLLTDLLAAEISLPDARSKRDQLQMDLQGIYEGAPRTLPKAFKAAQIALKLNEELTFTDAEIDVFLPAQLRKQA